VSVSFLAGPLLGVLLVLAGTYVLAFGPAIDRLPAISAVVVGAGLGGSMLMVWAGLRAARFT